MNKMLKQVKEFHDTFDCLVGNVDVLEPLDIRQLRIKLLFEELVELSVASDCNKTMANLCDKHVFNAINTSAKETDMEDMRVQVLYEQLNENNITDGNNVDLVEELDALADIQYVLNGKILTSGLYNCFDENFDIVHANNMTKAHRSVEHAQETIDKYNKNNTDVLHYVEKNGRYLVLNDSKKLIKPHDHTKVKLKIS